MSLKVGSLSLERLKFSNLYSAYLGMSPREQTMALIGAAVALILVFVLPVTVASGRIGKLEREVQQGKGHLRDIIRAIDSYNRKKATLSQMQKSLAGGFDSSISTTLESMAEQSGIKEKIDSLKEKPTSPSDLFDIASVDVRLRRVSLEQLVDFLYRIENQPDKMLRLRQLSIKPRFDNKQEMDVSFTVSTYRLLEGVLEGM